MVGSQVFSGTTPLGASFKKNDSTDFANQLVAQPLAMVTNVGKTEIGISFLGGESSVN